ncbi:MAG: HPr family phosphocarrier protein [Pseudomonadales bacterium]
MQRRNIVLINPRGLHARVASKIVDTTKAFAASVQIEWRDKQVDAKSIMALLMLGAPVGSELTITTEGEDEVAALARLVHLAETGFGELEDEPF